MLDTSAISPIKRRLIGAYFCHEYSYAAAALMNPSIVLHPDQSGLDRDQLRFVMSMRAVGEGHISSIAFREGIAGPDRSEEHTSELQSLMRNSYAVFSFQKKIQIHKYTHP